MSVLSSAHSRFESHSVSTAAVSSWITLAGRALFAAIFINSGFLHFMPQTAAYAASQGVPFASLLVPVSGLLAIAGGLSILLGWRTKLGAWLLVLFLVPVTLMMHAFWAVKDPMMGQLQFAMFMKNLSMLGAALLITQFGAGPLSVDAARARHQSAR